ncbi:chromosomal replication initiator protein [Oribacterium sp. KHPX15]|uniref:DnaA/Hda family protein n=1 Tax=Oribacterium sp. KHPX15 TaxID=1855342 RepID=UPI0008956FA8|nr:DnaA/Hda family protein [Oribacterium sp. KHPX15]SEA70090.1 chromosomal replication initiator protein [Oribacterium sp. KHPX15]
MSHDNKMSSKSAFNTHLSAVYTFKNFINCEENMIAFAAAKSVAFETEVYNPLFLYGESGTGKTHLLHAIGNHICDHYNNMDVMYITAEMFINEYSKVSDDIQENEIREKYRDVDVLLIDDIQLMSGNEKMLRELEFTVDALIRDEMQVVISADKPPKKLDGFSTRMKKLLGMGLVTELRAPNNISKETIIRMKAQEQGVLLEEDVFKYISANCNADVAEIEGVMTSIAAYYQIYKPVINLETAKNILKNVFC